MTKYTPAKADPTFRPHSLSDELCRQSQAALRRLLDRPSDFARTLQHRRGRIEVYAPSDDSALRLEDRAFLESRGFRMLARCHEWAPTMFGEVASRYEVWVDPTTTMQAHVVVEREWGVSGRAKEWLDAVSCRDGAVFMVANFADGTGLVMLPDDTTTASFQNDVRDALSGTERIADDFPKFEAKYAECVREGRRPLGCPDVETLMMHDELHGRFLRTYKGAVEGLKLEAMTRLMPVGLMMIGAAIGTALGIASGSVWLMVLAFAVATLLRVVVQVLRPRYPLALEPVFGTRDVDFYDLGSR